MELWVVAVVAAVRALAGKDVAGRVWLVGMWLVGL